MIDIEKILALDNSRERSSPSGEKKQIIATYAEYKKVVELQCREYTVKHCIKTDCGIMISYWRLHI